MGCANGAAEAALAGKQADTLHFKAVGRANAEGLPVNVAAAELPVEWQQGP